MKKTRTPVVSRALLISLLALAVMAFAGASGAGPLGLIVASEDPVVVEGECPDEGDEIVAGDPDADPDDGTEGEDPEGEDPEGEDPEGEDPEGEDPEGEDPEGEDPEGEDPEGDAEECEAEEEPTVEEPAEEPADEVVYPEGREGDCYEAAGLVDTDEDGEFSVDESYGDVVAPFGQKHSMEVLLANCQKNPQAPGLLRALEVHQMHLERWEARAEMRAEREAAKAERAAARDAAKAERAAAREAAKAARAAAKAAGGHGKGHGH
jgi:hypothetical protein